MAAWKCRTHGGFSASRTSTERLKKLLAKSILDVETLKEALGKY
ncbi:hypothetical protein [Mesorhizobium sp. M0213]